MTQKIMARALPMAIPFIVSTADDDKNTLAMDLSVIPRVLRRPIVEIFSNSIISRPDIILKPATMVISTRMKRTLKSIRLSQSNICGYLDMQEDARTVVSSSAV